jgi:hypothetical protein
MAGAMSKPADASPPDDFVRRTLRTWAVAAAVYAAVLGVAVAVGVPWKTPAANLALLAYAALHGAAALGLWRATRTGWRLGVAAALLGFVALIVVLTGLLSSFAYLWGTFGDFGLGAGVGALLFASVALQVLGLFPALMLRALLRREVRARFAGGRPWHRAVLGLLLVPPLTAAYVHARVDVDPLAPVSAEGRQQAIDYLRAALLRDPRPALDALKGVPVGEGPLYVSAWDRGELYARVTGEGADLAEAVERAAEALTTHPKLAGRRVGGGRLEIDRVVARTPVFFADLVPVVALSVNPGLDGLRRSDGDTERVLLPADLVKQQLFGHAPLVPGIRELRLGLDAARVLERLGLVHGDLERLRTETWVEFEGKALPTYRGNTPGPPEGEASWRAAAIAGGDFVLRQIMPDGRFHYQYFPLADRHPDPRRSQYSLPRHAGTVYSLALLYGLTGLDRFKTGAERAIAWLDGRIPNCGGPDQACVAKGNHAELGSTALTLVGMLEYQRRTGDRRYEGRVRKLVNFVLAMQRPNGDFHHAFDVKAQKAQPEVRSMFYSEEAALALVMAHEALGDEAILDAARRALDYLTGPKYDFFLGHFIYGADHWTCIAADEAWPRLKHPQYLEFCRGYAQFIDRLQYAPGNWTNHDFRGHYGFTGLMVPQAPGAAGFTEAVISTYDLSVKHGTPDPVLRRQAALALDALARDQVRADNAWMMPNPEAADGGIRRSLVEQEVRIDFTQHALSALIRAAVWADAG